MKKYLAVLLAAITVMSASACGKKAEAPSSGGTAESAATQSSDKGSSQSSEKDSSGASEKDSDKSDETTPTIDPNLAKDENGEVYGMTEENAIEQADMDKVDGIELESPDTDENAGKGSIANMDIEIQDAKVIENDGAKVVIISYKFKNNNSSPKAFASLIDTDVYQGDTALRGAIVTGVEGVNTLSATQAIEKGESAVVEEAYTLSDDTTEITVNAYEYGVAATNIISKHFTL